MIKKTIKYHDFDGDEREDDFYFSMNQVQFARIDRLFPGGIEAYAIKCAKDKNAGEMFRLIDTIVSEAYGERIDNRFVKTAPNGQKLADFFTNTEAYDNLLIELMSSEDKLVGFLSACLNTDAQNRVQAEWEKRKNENSNRPKLTPVDKE